MSEQASPFHRFNLRRQSAEHPMAMFVIVVLATLALMALMPPPGLAFPSLAPMFALDRVYTRGLRCCGTFVPRGGTWARMSDHLPLVAEFERAA